MCFSFCCKDSDNFQIWRKRWLPICFSFQTFRWRWLKTFQLALSKMSYFSMHVFCLPQNMSTFYRWMTCWVSVTLAVIKAINATVCTCVDHVCVCVCVYVCVWSRCSNPVWYRTCHPKNSLPPVIILHRGSLMSFNDGLYFICNWCCMTNFWFLATRQWIELIESVYLEFICFQISDLSLCVLIVAQAPPTPKKQQETPMETDNFQKRRMSFTVSPG